MPPILHALEASPVAADAQGRQFSIPGIWELLSLHARAEDAFTAKAAPRKILDQVGSPKELRVREVELQPASAPQHTCHDQCPGCHAGLPFPRS